VKAYTVVAKYDKVPMRIVRGPWMMVAREGSFGVDITHFEDYNPQAGDRIVQVRDWQVWVLDDYENHPSVGPIGYSTDEEVRANHTGVPT
jgi:hypothetical protein